jgi:hypothetical protein
LAQKAGLRGGVCLPIKPGDEVLGVLIFRFMTEKNRIRPRVSIDAAKASNLTISSKVLRAADVVGGAGGAER